MKNKSLLSDTVWLDSTKVIERGHITLREEERRFAEDPCPVLLLIYFIVPASSLAAILRSRTNFGSKLNGGISSHGVSGILALSDIRLLSGVEFLSLNECRTSVDTVDIRGDLRSRRDTCSLFITPSFGRENRGRRLPHSFFFLMALSVVPVNQKVLTSPLPFMATIPRSSMM